MSATPRWATERTDRPTYGGKVAEVAEALGIALMPWQRQVLDVALEHEDGRLVYRNVLVAVPRQSGKTTLTLPLMLWRMLAAPSQSVYGAQNRLSARQKLLDDHWPVIARSSLAAQFTVSRATGQEALRTTDSILRVISSDESAAHGQTLSLAVVDEAWAVGPEVEQAVKPAMVTKSNGQLWAVSTAGNYKSTWWRGKVEMGREAVEKGRTDGLAFFEWSAPPGAPLADPGTWRECMPALGYTVDEATVAGDIAGMNATEARRAFLNQWADEADDDGSGWGLVDRDLWASTAW
jgi:phage terminase large subunit-like protein